MTLCAFQASSTIQCFFFSYAAPIAMTEEACSMTRIDFFFVICMPTSEQSLEDEGTSELSALQ